MIEIFKKSDFKTMPWKNGGGNTTEIFRMPIISDNNFLFRLSRAEVLTDGPFSIFPNIDRILILIEGAGVHLTGEKREVVLNKNFIPLSFRGEEAFSCSLINGACIDFNIMTDRNFANSTISVLHPTADNIMNFTAQCDLKFIYDIGSETLYKLEKNDQYNMGVQKESPLIVIDLKVL